MKTVGLCLELDGKKWLQRLSYLVFYSFIVGGKSASMWQM